MNLITRTFLLMMLMSGFSLLVEAQTVADLRHVMMQEDYKTAKTMAEKMLSSRLMRSDMAEIEYYVALSQLRLGEYTQAEQTFRKIITLRPADSIYDRSVIGLSDAFFAQSYYDKALKELNHLIYRRGSSSDMISLAYLKSARANLKLARWGKAREFLEKIIAEYPQSFESIIAKQLMNERQYFTVQVGSFADKGRAENLVQELKDRKEYAYIVEAKVSAQQSTYRVRVGQLSSLKEAQALESKLSGLGYATIIYP